MNKEDSLRKEREACTALLLEIKRKCQDADRLWQVEEFVDEAIREARTAHGALVVSETALDEAYDQGYEKGWWDGYAKREHEAPSETALDEAYEQGKEDAGHANYDKGYEAGVAWGYKDGKADGIEEGYQRGYTEGFDEGEFTAA
jgi:flagellar biosynthesis/type III secretory pathway protein FliH